MLAFNGDVNGDNRFTNDILFVPASADQVTITNGTFAQLQAYLAGDNSTKDCRGQAFPNATPAARPGRTVSTSVRGHAPDRQPRQG